MRILTLNSILLLFQLGLPMPVAALPAPGEPETGADQRREATLVVSGTIIEKEEIWDRRTNPLMGRPDVLKEIRLQLASLTLHSGRLAAGTDQIAVAFQEHKLLLAYRSLTQGSSGKFYLSGSAPPYDLLAVNSVLKPDPPPKPALQVAPQATATPQLAFPEQANARELKASPALQKRAAQAIARKYGMTEAKTIFLTSFSGPMPPEGGYLYWGVTGKIKGKWQVWQPGNKGALRPGSKLTDPKRHQK